jgi:serine palmitoyltransferase
MVRGVKESVINSASFDFFNISRDPSIHEVVVDALNHYGVGSCGPRGFYGTIDQHLILEQDVADFMGTQEAICYSDGSSTIASAIPAFAKKGDLLLVDEACAEPIISGANLSRSTVRYFRHNDMADLRRLLQAIADEDVKLKRDSLQQRRFIIVEGIYRNTGDICPLDQVMKLRDEFFYRVILDESLSFGVLGARGRGITEHFNIPPMEVDVVTFTLDTVLSSVGGMCVGSHEIVDHQRLSGAGYCYSASSAPFLCAAAIQALKIVKSNCSSFQDQLRENIRYLRQELAHKVPGLKLISTDETPILHLAIRRANAPTSSSSPPSNANGNNNSGATTPVTPGRTTRRTSRVSGVASTAPTVSTSPEEDWRLLVDIAAECVARGVAIVTNKFTLLNKSVADLPPTLLLTVTAGYSEQDMNKIVKVLAQAAKLYIR